MTSKFGNSSTYGLQGPRGYPGVGISNITFNDNNDGTVTINITMTDSTTYGPFTGTLVSDNLISLNKLTLTGTNLTDKFLIKNNSNNNIFSIDTENLYCEINASTTISRESYLTHSLQLNGNNSTQKFNVVDVSYNPIFNIDTYNKTVTSNVYNLITKSDAGNTFNALELKNESTTASSNTSLKMTSANSAGTQSQSGLITYSSGGFSLDNPLTITGSLTSGAISSDGNITQTGPTNLSTGTGTISLNGATTCSGSFTANGATSISNTLNITGSDNAKKFNIKNNAGSDIFYINTVDPASTTFNSNSTIFTITPGYKGSTQTNATVTFNITGTGLFYFWDAVEIASTLTTTNLITSSQSLTGSTYNALALTNSSTTANSNVKQSWTCSANASATSITGDITFRRRGNDTKLTGFEFSSPAVGGVNMRNITLRNNSSTGWTGTGIEFQGTQDGGLQTYAFIDFNGYGFHVDYDWTPFTSGNAGQSLGLSGAYWSNLYVWNSPIIGSDRNYKQNISPSPLGLNFINLLTPVKYQMIDGVRYHYGLISQDVEQVLTDLSISSNDFAGFIKSDVQERIQDGVDIDNNPIYTTQNKTHYALRYEEFIAPMIKAIQELKTIVDNQTTLINALNARIDILENS